MRDNKQKLGIVIFIFLLISIGLVYAYLNSMLIINGTTKLAGNTWDIHFANLNVTNGSVEAINPAAINQTDNTKISYSIELSEPGDFYEFTVDVVNAGTIPGKVSISSLSGIDSSLEDIIEYTITYTNGNPIQINDILNHSSSKDIKVRVYFVEDIANDDLPSDDINLNITYTLQYVQSDKEEENAGNLLQNLSTTNSCITKYEGDVTDRVGITEEATNVYFNKCVDKRNIIFAGYCWKAIRTTETGGLKILYNGEIVDGKCESNRENHKGIVQSSNVNDQNIATSYLYGSSFTYDTTNNTFTLVDTETATWSGSTYENLISKFTCMSSMDTCSTMYQINSYKSNTSAYLSYYIIANTNYAQIGTSSFNADMYSPAMVGYMFNKVYNYNSKLTNIEYVSDNTYAYGDSYTDNGNGTYTIDSATLVTTWPTTSTEYNAIKNKYICKNPTNDACSDVWYITSTGSTSFSYYKSSANYKFASSYTYENGTYTLSGESSNFWNLASNDYKTYLNNHHYTCWNDNGTCTTISYVYYYSSQFSYYITLSDGKNVNDALDEMLSNNDVNRYNSSIKGIVDSWYAQNLFNKTNMLEDAIHCNARNIIDYTGWNPSGGSVTNYLQFKNFRITTNLVCPNETDQFAVSNNKAKLTYPVALLSEEERYSASSLGTGVTWWSLSPGGFDIISASCRIFGPSGYMSNPVSKSFGVRPAVTLLSSTVISSGTGTEDDPWIVQE